MTTISRSPRSNYQRLTVSSGKKLKRRLEDLERRAGSSDGGSPPLDNEKPWTASRVTKTAQTTPKAPKQAVPKPVAQGLLSPPLHPGDMLLAAHVSYDERERPHSPPFMGYSAYPPPDDMIMGAYSQPQTYQPMTAEAYPHYMESHAAPVTLPSMTDFSDAIRRESPGYPGEDSMSPYMNYGYLPGIDMGAGPTSASYDHSNPHVSFMREQPLSYLGSTTAPPPPSTSQAPSTLPPFYPQRP